MFGACHAPMRELRRVRIIGLACVFGSYVLGPCLLGLSPTAAQTGALEPDLADRQPVSPPLVSEIIRLTPSTAVTKIDEVLHDFARLPPYVALMRARILNAARTGDLAQVKALITHGQVRIGHDVGGEIDPIKIWRGQYPESEGVEVLSILISILETGFVRMDAGNEKEIYVWPYFAHVPLKNLDKPALVELYRIVTAFDVQRMREAGAYTFFRLGIGADGTWHYFQAGP